MTERETRTQWFTEARFGMFIHWGLYAIPGRGEWYMSEAKIPAGQYERYMQEFTTKAYDPGAWARLELDIPEEYAQYNMQPQNPTFSGNDGNYPIILLDKDGNDRTMTLHTHDGGMTWIWPKLSAVDVS